MYTFRTVAAPRLNVNSMPELAVVIQFVRVLIATKLIRFRRRESPTTLYSTLTR